MRVWSNGRIPACQAGDTSPILVARSKKFQMNQDKLKAFLYLLMRDEVVPGIVAGLVKSVMTKPFDGKVEYSNQHLENYAAELASHLTKENS
jgi:hypothetical protein